MDAAVASAVREGSAQRGSLHLLRGALAVVTRLRAVDGATAGELRRTGRTLAGATGALLAVGLAATTADLAAGLGGVRALARGSELRDDQGRLLLRAGSVLNPLASLPLTARILVIDAQDPAEIAWARTQRAANRATIHLVVNPDREGGWAAWQALQDQLQSPVFLLDAQLQGRLGVQVTPSLIESQGTELVVTETVLPRTIAEHER